MDISHASTPQLLEIQQSAFELSVTTSVSCWAFWSCHTDLWTSCSLLSRVIIPLVIILVSSSILNYLFSFCSQACYWPSLTLEANVLGCAWVAVPAECLSGLASPASLERWTLMYSRNLCCLCSAVLPFQQVSGWLEYQEHHGLQLQCGGCFYFCKESYSSVSMSLSSNHNILFVCLFDPVSNSSLAWPSLLLAEYHAPELLDVER